MLTSCFQIFWPSWTAAISGMPPYSSFGNLHIANRVRNAEVAGMQRELGLSSKQFTWLLTIFYIAYVVFEFQALLWKFIPPRYYTATAVFIWYVTCTQPWTVLLTYSGVPCRHAKPPPKTGTR